MNEREATAKPERRHDIDWLRVIAVLLLFYFHPARVFYLWGGWYIQNEQLSLVLSVLSRFIEHWHMQLFFVLAGAASWFALRKRSGGQYTKERLLRLLVPLIFGLLVIVPPQIYLDFLANRNYLGTYLQFYPRFFDPQFTNGFDMGHLWFIAYLFGFSLIALPLFLFLRRPTGQRWVEKLVSFLSKPVAFLILVLPILAADYVLLGFYPNPIYFIVFFIYGYLFMADKRFEEVIDKLKAVGLIVGAGGYGVWISLVTSNIISWDWLEPIPKSLITWLSLIALLGYGRKFLRSSNRFLHLANESSYPVYILHQTVIVVIAFYVVRWDTGVGIKFAAIVLVSLIATPILYVVFVAQTKLTRFLFGMRPRRGPASIEATAEPSSAASD